MRKYFVHMKTVSAVTTLNSEQNIIINKHPLDFVHNFNTAQKYESNPALMILLNWKDITNEDIETEESLALAKVQSKGV